MIRVHALLQPRSKQRATGVQTDSLPQLGSNHYRRTHRAQGNENHHGIGASMTKSKCGKWRDDVQGTVSRLEAKEFRFLRFQEELLRNAILKQLDGRQPSRQERMKLRQQYTFNFISNDPHSYRGPTDDDFVLEIPQEYTLDLSLEELVEGVRKAYEEVGLGASRRGREAQAMHRKIAQTVQTLLALSSSTIVEPSLPQWQSKVFLPNFLRRYVTDHELKGHLNDPSQAKLKLLGFYQDIYNLYEATPFNEQVGEPMMLPESSSTPASYMHSPITTLSKGKSSRNSEESFIKLRFYNNLRKEVQSLGQDTEKIMILENNKLGHP